MGDQVGDMVALRGIRLQEFAPGGNIEEEVADLKLGPAAEGGVPNGKDPSLRSATSSSMFPPGANY